jgi:hypothetical protein
MATKHDASHTPGSQMNELRFRGIHTLPECATSSSGTLQMRPASPPLIAPARHPAALVGSLPLVILYAFFVEHYVSAMTGAVKE